MDLKQVFLWVVGGIVVIEICEHFLFPLFWYWKMRSRRSLVGLNSYVGKEARVLTWAGNRGTILVDGEIWKAESTEACSPNDRVRITAALSLTLFVSPIRKASAPNDVATDI
ncbi:NfeD family protein [Thermodesulforhabdus norvegica]|uniref:NfeD-like C-terminal, partner-binding n=1 Tax=Thermodesulforhabdus norvegica TaxID=39841 RepID=A0A1I4V7C1_9BACT|nr:NfeD family protein [Thermodesulforhabdus norvegica]SFM97106.1 NfeD-like C-terminal, partner-binding [Thermodesulforhabdus norvegica]